MKDAENKNVSQDVTPEQMLVAEDENERELPDKQLEGVVGGVTVPEIPKPNCQNPTEVRGPAHNPFA